MYSRRAIILLDGSFLDIQQVRYKSGISNRLNIITELNLKLKNRIPSVEPYSAQKGVRGCEEEKYTGNTDSIRI
jgi:hypothetical protein